MENENSFHGTAVLGGTYIGKTMKVKGNLTCDEDITIQGNVSGKIKVGQTLLIGEYGDVTADINARVVIIVGNTRGNITASQKVEIRSRGRFDGNIKSKILVVEEGALLIGDVNKEEK